MKILYFSKDYTPHDYRFLSSLAETGHEVHFLRLERRKTQFEDRPIPPQIHQVRWYGGRKPFAWRDAPVLLMDLRRILRQLQPDLVHAGPVQSAAFLAALAGVQPLVTMSWGSDLLVDADLMPKRTRLTLNRSSLLFADCQAVRNKAAEFGFPAERTILFPWGVDLDQFSPNANPERSRELSWGEDAFVLLSVRSWETIYGVDVLVRGFARAAERAPGLRLFLLADGSQAGIIRQILSQHKMMERVRFPGRVTQADLPPYYQASNLYVSASHSDGSSVSLMEALASGLPALVSDIPGNREWITPGVEGWLFRDGDDSALADGILEALRQREQMAKMGAAARRLAEQRANWQVNFQTMLQGYAQAVQSPHRKSAIKRRDLIF